VDRNIAFLELKYGNIYGGYPNYYAITEASLLVFELDSNKIFLETFANNADVNIIHVSSEVNELGNTIGKKREVINMRTGRQTEYNEEFRMDEQALDNAFYKLRPSRRFVKGFFMKNLRKYNVRDIITFDGRRDIFLVEKSQVEFRYQRIHDVQKEITEETNYLFSLNKLAKVINFQQDMSFLRSNNLQYRLHPIAARQINPGSAAFDAARLLMVHNEFKEHKDDFLLKAALLVNKIEMANNDK